MASITIRNLDEALKARLRLRAASHQRSMEEEARDVLRVALSSEAPQPANLAAAIRGRLSKVGFVNLRLPARQAMREPPDFES